MAKHRNIQSPWKTMGHDLLASLVVFLVALPLCMGIAIASGAPVAAGLVTGIVGGLVVGVFAGSPLQVSGPAAGLTVVCAEVINEHGLAALGVVVALAGLIQLVAGLCHLGQWFRAVSPAVVHGMLAGIGILILSSQLHVMVDDRPRQGGLANLLSIPAAIQKGMPLPSFENREQRAARLTLLQTMGALHERQTEIDTQVQRLVSQPKDGRSTPGEMVDLSAYIPIQKTVLAELEAIVDAPECQLLNRLDEEDGQALVTALNVAQARVMGALANLDSASPRAAETQREAAAALADVLASLKNHDWAAKVGLASIAIIVVWQLFAPGRLRFIPGPLLAVAGATAAAWALSLPVLYVEVPDRLIDGLTLPSLQVLADVSLPSLARAALFMAVIASAETLLCATAVDRLHTGARTQYDRELAAQGVGNVLCGLVGALPMTGVIVRSAANIQAGGKSRLSAFLHGLWLLLFVVVCGALLRMIPTAALAGILVYTGFRLIDFRGLARLWQHERSEAYIFLTTVVLIVVEDLLVGVVAGLALSATKLLWRFSRLDVRLVNSEKVNNDGAASAGRVTVRMTGAATFLRLPILAAKLEEVPAEGDVNIDSARLTYVDQACRELLQSWLRQRETLGQRISLDRQRLLASHDGETVEDVLPASQDGDQRERKTTAA
jgi:MFS superfamily sulfate permease-like transporter